MPSFINLVLFRSFLICSFVQAWNVQYADGKSVIWLTTVFEEFIFSCDFSAASAVAKAEFNSISLKSVILNTSI